MKKKLVFFSIALAMASSIFAYKYANIEQNRHSGLDMESLEAQSAGEGWWDRCDYVCVSVQCQCIFVSYQGQVAQYVGDGAGTVAHTWSCSGCGDCGWTM